MTAEKGGEGAIFSTNRTEVSKGADGRPLMEKVTVSYDENGTRTETREPVAVQAMRSEKRRKTGRVKDIQHGKK